MPAQTIWYDSTETGAATLNNANGSLIEVLRTCLVNGFNSKSVSSISVASGVATVTAAAHGFSGTYGKLVLIEGSGTAALNGRKQPSNITTNTFTFPAPGVADGTYTGTVTAKRAPLGWAETHTATNTAIFAPTAVEASAHSLRIIDNSAIAAMARAVGIPTANITDINTYTGEYPSSTQYSGGGYWQKGVNTATARRWFVVGDDMGFYVGTEIGSATGTFVVYFFGDINSFYPGDSGRSLITQQSTTNSSTAPTWRMASSNDNPQSNPAASSTFFAPRGVLASETAPVTQGIFMLIAGVISGSNNLPNGTNYDRTVIHPVSYCIGQGPCVRGVVPGLGYFLANSTFAILDVVQSVDQNWLMVPIGVTGAPGTLPLSLSGWR